MSKLIYVDTNVFVSYLRGEYGNVLTINQEYEGQKLFERTKECEFTICISELFIEEILGVTKLSKESVNAFFKRFTDTGKLFFIADLESAQNMAAIIASSYKTPKKDAFHAACAICIGAILITWNIKDFANIKG